ncbi:MAG: gliding motility-associated C-terminal domain-containing protein [Bacteroidota bacterium]
MRYLYALLAVFLLLLCLPASLHATHNRAGDITVEIVGGDDCGTSLTVRAIITTYTKASSVDADRDSLEICWGDGFCETIVRTNGPGNPPQGEVLDNDIKFNTYIGLHTYGSRGIYEISTTDPNRIFGIENIPNSLNTPFALRTIYRFGNPNFQLCNSTIFMTVPPIDFACVGQVYTYNPGAVDPDLNDSIGYSFTVPLFGVGLPIENYVLPDLINPGPDNNININPVTGDVTWNAPRKAGEYNIAIQMVSYRNGIPIDTVIRDMQILVQECNNVPPEIETEFDEICVVAGEVLEFDVTATAPLFEENQQVRLQAFGAPFEQFINPSTFTPEEDVYVDDPLTKTFRWETTCEHIADQFYTVVFRAVDNAIGGTGGLATLKSVRIKVVGPPPEDVQVDADGEQLTISWESPYDCEETINEYFQGFTVWRREGPNDFPIDTCTPGLEGRGYVRLNDVPMADIQDERYVFFDADVQRGKTYCYRVLAVFSRLSASGQNFFTLVESLPSEEVCEQLERTVPIVTQVTVEETDDTDGAIRVRWSKPDPEALDTLETNPGPYRYELFRADGLNPADADFVNVWVSPNFPTFSEANDTIFTDMGINTVARPYTYRIDFFVKADQAGGINLGSTELASSIFLNPAPTDEAVDLSWDFEVPWSNGSYTVFRENPTGSGTFDSIATVVEPLYRDEGLINGETYCYQVRSTGSYSIAGIIDPIINFSQEACAVPIDNVPPCPPLLTVSNLCETSSGCLEDDEIRNELAWEPSFNVCGEDGADVAAYRVYYTPAEGGTLEAVERVEGALNNNYLHTPPSDRGLAGCYAVTAIDSTGNESGFSNIICVDNCPIYTLPNTFTPNGDGQNDEFIPFPFCFIERIDFKVFNRWGQLVFQTSDPNIQWDGRNLSGQELAEGTYYYSCQIFEQRIDPTLPQQTEALNGYIELIR